jgi:transposase
MSAVKCPLGASVPVSDARPVPFATEHVTLTRQEHIQLVMQANSWKTLHRKAVERAQWREGRYQRVLRQIKEQAGHRESALRAELEEAQAKIRDLQKRLFGRKTERRNGGSEQQSRGPVVRASRGHRRGASGHGRTRLPHLPERVEVVELDDPQCPNCGLALADFPGTEDAEVLEIEVKAYRRVIRRRRYRPICDCGCVPGIVAALPPPRLIERGKFGVSVWVSVLLDKYLYGRPSHRLLQDLADHGLNMSPGTLAGGLQAIAPLFEPLEQALVVKLRSEPHWHADETRWAVFVVIVGKAGHRWYLWVFHSRSAVHYVLDESRSAEVVGGELAGVESGIISCDRYSAYKKFARDSTLGSCSHFAGRIKDATSSSWPTPTPIYRRGRCAGWTPLASCFTSMGCVFRPLTVAPSAPRINWHCSRPCNEWRVSAMPNGPIRGLPSPQPRC